jgi:DNA-binding NtrC family response regulator
MLQETVHFGEERNMLKYPHVALLTEEEVQATHLGRLLREHVMLWHAASVRELEEYLRNRDIDVLLCNWRFQNGTWKMAVEKMQAKRPDLPVIVLSQVAGEKEWVEVIEAGGFDLLVPPYWQRPMLAALEQATASREARKWQRAQLQLSTSAS